MMKKDSNDLEQVNETNNEGKERDIEDNSEK